MGTVSCFIKESSLLLRIHQMPNLVGRDLRRNVYWVPWVHQLPVLFRAIPGDPCSLPLYKEQQGPERGGGRRRPRSPEPGSTRVKGRCGGRTQSLPSPSGAFLSTRGQGGGGGNAGTPSAGPQWAEAVSRPCSTEGGPYFFVLLNFCLRRGVGLINGPHCHPLGDPGLGSPNC